MALNLVTAIAAPATKNPLPPVTATVGTSSVQIVNANPTRTGLVIVNLSSTTVSFGIGQSAVLYGGISITPAGIWEMDELLFSQNFITAIASALTTLSIQEFS